MNSALGKVFFKKMLDKMKENQSVFSTAEASVPASSVVSSKNLFQALFFYYYLKKLFTLFLDNKKTVAQHILVVEIIAGLLPNGLFKTCPPQTGISL